MCTLNHNRFDSYPAPWHGPDPAGLHRSRHEKVRPSGSDPMREGAPFHGRLTYPYPSWYSPAALPGGEERCRRGAQAEGCGSTRPGDWPAHRRTPTDAFASCVVAATDRVRSIPARDGSRRGTATGPASHRQPGDWVFPPALSEEDLLIKPKGSRDRHNILEPSPAIASGMPRTGAEPEPRICPSPLDARAPALGGPGHKASRPAGHGRDIGSPPPTGLRGRPRGLSQGASQGRTWIRAHGGRNSDAARGEATGRLIGRPTGGQVWSERRIQIGSGIATRPL